jgi:ketosteroid isomerase-like protein
MTDHATVRDWVTGYERAWRTSGTEGLLSLFTTGASYLHSPYSEPVVGIDAIQEMWEGDRDGPDEAFTITMDIVAVEGPTAVVRAEVRYGEPVRQEYRDLWVLRIDDDGRCDWFEEWPYWPGRPYSARHAEPEGA